MIKSRQPEITIKFTELPELPAEGKKATLFFQSENGLNIKAIVTRKTAAKQLKKTEQWESWIGAIQGKIAQIEGNTILVVDAGLQIFEKKQKQPKKDAA